MLGCWPEAASVRTGFAASDLRCSAVAIRRGATFGSGVGMSGGSRDCN